MKATLFYLVTLSQLILSAVADIQRIPLYRRRDDYSEFVSVATNDLRNGMVGGIVKIGNPPQKFVLAFDLSTGFSWVKGVECTSSNCSGRRSYNSLKSTTVVSTDTEVRVDYGTEDMSSTLFLDTFNFEDITVEGMPFGSAYQMSGFTNGFDGFLGLGRNINLNKTGTHYAKRDLPPTAFIPNSFVSSSRMSGATMGMYYSYYGYNSFSYTGVTSGGSGTVRRNYGQDEPAGYLIIGGVDTDAIKGELYYINIADDYESGNWVVPVKAAKFMDGPVFKVKKEARAILSSTSDVIGLPNKQAKQFQERWYAEYDKENNTFNIPCCLMDRLSAFKIRLGDINLTLPPSYWSYKRKASSCCEMCPTHIGKSNSDTDYSIGSSFTKAFYIQYDFEYDRVGLAMKKDDRNDGVKLCRSDKK